MQFKLHSIIVSSVVALAALTLAGCGQKEAVVEALPCAPDSLTRDFIDPSGDVISLGLDGQNISPLINGFFTASTPDGVTVYRYAGANDGSAEIEVVPGLSGLRSAGAMSFGVIPVARQGGHIELVNEKGETVASLELPEGEITQCDPYFTEGVMRFTTDAGGVGLIEPSGKIVVEPRYSALGLPDDGILIAMTEAQAGESVVQNFSVIDLNGNEKYTFPADVTPVNLEISEGMVAVRTRTGFALADAKHSGNLIQLPSGVRSVDELSSGLAVVSAGRGKKGVVRTDGSPILDMRYNQVRIGSGGLVAYCDGAKWYIGSASDLEFHEVGGATLLTPAPLQEKKNGFDFVARSAEGFYLVDSNGERVGTTRLVNIDCGRPIMNVVNTDYPRSTTTVELPGEEEWTED